jgi:YVTN family beta-propeller protein
MRTIGLGLAFALALSGPALAAPSDTYRIMDRIPLPDGGFDYATFDPATGRVYLARTDFTTVYDTRTKMLSQLMSAGHGHMALPVPGTHELLVTQGGAGIARFVDSTTDKVIADVPVGKNPDAATYDPATHHLFVVNHTSGDVTEIDPAAHKAVATIQVGGALEFAVPDGQGRIFVNDEDAGEIAVIDAAAHKTAGRYKMAGCKAPTGLAYDAAAKLLISSCDGTAKVLRADTGQEVASLAIGAGPDAVIYDAQRRLAMIPSSRAGELDIISLANPQHVAVVQRAPTETGTRTGTIDPAGGTVYLIGAKVSARNAAGRAGRQPGSYELLVVAR